MGDGFHHRDATLASKMTLRQDVWADVLEGCKAEPASHVAGSPQVIVDGRYSGRDAHAVPPFMLAFAGRTSLIVRSQLPDQNPGRVDNFAGVTTYFGGNFSLGRRLPSFLLSMRDANA